MSPMSRFGAIVSTTVGRSAASIAVSAGSDPSTVIRGGTAEARERGLDARERGSGIGS
jgi:hypothetical protein